MREKLVGYEIHTLHKMFGRRLDMLFEEHNISKMQSWIIHYLYRHREEEVFQKDIESHFQIAGSTVTGILKELEREGYVTRCGVPSDARLKRLALTEQGTAIQMEVFRILDENEREIRRDIPEEDLETFFRVAESMKKNISRTEEQRKEAASC